MFIRLLLLFVLVGCETATKVTVKDLDEEDRVFSKIEYGKEVKFRHAVIVDVRSRFEHEMSRPPRSFFAYHKDWDLKNYSGEDLKNKVKELQRLLALKGIDPLTQVVILGKGLSGNGEEFLVASTLLALGVKRINFLNEKQVKKALVAKGLPKIENVEYWSKPLAFQVNCLDKQKTGSPEVTIAKKNKGSLKPFEVYSDDLSIKRKTYPKSLRMRVSSPDTYWAHGLALYFMDQGRMSCVL